MIESKSKAVWDWFYGNEEISRLYFNFSDVQLNNTVITTETSDNAVKEFIDGTKEKVFDFAVVQYKELNTVDVNSSENAEVLTDAETLMNWIDEQESKRNYPKFPPNCVITKVENLQNMPSVSGMDDIYVKYLFSCRINYIERKP